MNGHNNSPSGVVPVSSDDSSDEDVNWGCCRLVYYFFQAVLLRLFTLWSGEPPSGEQPSVDMRTINIEVVQNDAHFRDSGDINSGGRRTPEIQEEQRSSGGQSPEGQPSGEELINPRGPPRTCLALVTSKEVSIAATSLIPLVISAMMLKNPTERNDTKYGKALSAGLLTLCLLLAFKERGTREFRDDLATFFFYEATRRGGQKVLYEKCFTFIVGIVLVFISFISATITMFSHNEWILYVSSLVANILSCLYTVVQVYMSDKYFAIVEPREDGTEIFTILQRSVAHPPIGRLVILQRNPRYPPFTMD